MAADPGQLMLLIPDALSPSDPGVTAWLDATSEVGARTAVVTDSQFLSMGTAGALGYAGLVLPDSIHAIGTDELVAAVRAYTQAGGKTFLTFDFAALTLNGDGVPVFPIPKSRLSDLAGVDYILYDKYLDKTTGLGPVTAMRSTLRELLVPPGKSAAYPPDAQAARSSAGVSEATPSLQGKARAAASDRGIPLLDAAGVAEHESLYLAPSVSDPGGARGFDPQQFQMLPSYSQRERAGASAKPARTVKIRYGRAFKGAAPTRSTRVALTSSTSRPLVAADDEIDKGADAQDALWPKAATDTGPDERHAYSGYLLGYLIYPTYQTEGDYLGTTLATSPDFGLVAGVNHYGAGQVMFVNLPLTYLKGRTDALPMHGFLGYFVKNVLDGIRLSAMPKAVPGITFNWHLDSKAAQAPMLALEKAGIFKNAGTSMHMTAGPDTITIGDGAGFDLDHNPTARAFLQRMVALGHSVGSHGGWIHDYYGNNANETNETQFLPYLVENRRAVANAIGRPSRDYSAPQGNNPTWAMTWLESQGVVGAYFGGHTGLGVTRQYRDGALLNPRLWVSPVTPFGNYATFEEFQDFNVPKTDVLGWYQALIDFDIAQNTARMVYAHPPGAADWMDVMKGLIAYANSKGKAKFKWYSIERLADFMDKRNQVVWSEARLDAQTSRITAAHPTSLDEMVWILPKDRYLKPTNVSGAAVANGGAYWLVKAKAVGAMNFKVKINPAYSGS
ncbi:polysaccharide deacetylase family protein [Oryzisolibacter propanilivorax]|nr:polysaccharide deacetylase family protein [Oryzisolibacter propanilivorax]